MDFMCIRGCFHSWHNSELWPNPESLYFTSLGFPIALLHYNYYNNFQVPIAVIATLQIRCIWWQAIQEQKGINILDSLDASKVLLSWKIAGGSCWYSPKCHHFQHPPTDTKGLCIFVWTIWSNLFCLILKSTRHIPRVQAIASRGRHQWTWTWGQSCAQNTSHSYSKSHAVSIIAPCSLIRAPLQVIILSQQSSREYSFLMVSRKLNW